MNTSPIIRTTTEVDGGDEGNPLLEGLTLTTSEVEMLPLIARDPFRNAAWRRQNQDPDLIRFYLQQVVVPTRTALRVGTALHRALKIALHQQDPRIAENKRQYFATGDSLVKPEFSRGIHDGMCILAETGAGKSHLIEAALSTIPQRIVRKNIPGIDTVTQITWIKIDMSGLPSVEALARRLVESVDNILGHEGQLLEATFRGKRSVQAMMQAAIRLLKTHFCGLIVFDEIQPDNFAVATAAPIRSWMLILANVGFGLVYAGNPLGFKLQMPKVKKATDRQHVYSTQIMRRLFSAENIRIDPAQSHADSDWLFFTKAVNGCHLFGGERPFDPNLELRKFQLTAGISDYYVELHCSIERLLAKNPAQVVDLKLVELAAKMTPKLKEMKHVIDAFLHKDLIALRLCSDIDYEYYAKLWHQEDSPKNTGQAVGPVGIVAMPSGDVNAVQSLIEDQNAANRRMKRNKDNAERELNPAAEAVRTHHLGELDQLISGKARNELEE